MIADPLRWWRAPARHHPLPKPLPTKKGSHLSNNGGMPRHSLITHQSVTKCVECGESFDTAFAGVGKPRSICGVACRKQRRNRQQLSWRKRCDCPQHVHGSVTGYGTYGCRCERCREANTIYTREKRAKQRAAGDD